MNVTIEDLITLMELLEKEMAKVDSSPRQSLYTHAELDELHRKVCEEYDRIVLKK